MTPPAGPAGANSPPSANSQPRRKQKTKPKQPTQADLLLDIASTAVLFRSTDGRCFAQIAVDSHRENHEIRSTGFRR
jgi:hypothetical protein